MTAAYAEYLSLIPGLLTARSVDPDEFDRIADLMDPLWWAMTDGERDEANAFAKKWAEDDLKREMDEAFR